MKMTADDTNRARVLITGKVLNGNRDKALPALEGACLSVVNKSLERGTKRARSVPNNRNLTLFTYYYVTPTFFIKHFNSIF